MGVGRAAIHRRLIAIAVLMGVWGIAIGARLYSIQVVQSEDFRGRAERQQQRILEISPHRGTIYDRHGNELAVSIEVDSLYAVPSEVDDQVATAAILSEILDVPAATLWRRSSSMRAAIPPRPGSKTPCSSPTTGPRASTQPSTHWQRTSCPLPIRRTRCISMIMLM